MRRAAVNILLIEDDQANVRLTEESFKRTDLAVRLHTAQDGETAICFLRRQGDFHAAPVPDLVLLDLNMPGKDGREVLREIKTDDVLKRIPVVILTTSEAESDIARCYELGANAYVKKPLDFEDFKQAIKNLSVFWFGTVKLPPKET